MISINQIKELREETGVSIAECRKALEEAGGDLERAREILRIWGKKLAQKRAERATGSGVVDSYVHPDKRIGVLLSLRCESDFVARSEDFKRLAHEICLHVAAMNPLFSDSQDVPEEFLAGERKIYQEQFAGSGKTQKIIDQIVDGKLSKYREEISLLSQPWIKDETKTIKDLVDEYIAKIGENIVIERFARFII